MRTRVAPAIIVFSFLVITPLAQAPHAPSVEDVLDRMSAYLTSYESTLAAITADETYDQREIVMAKAYMSVKPSIRAMRRLHSDVAFLRLPGNAEWAGFRNVQKVDGKAVQGGRIRFADLIAKGTDLIEQATAITMASSKYNLGAPRTTNMPTVPLEVFHPRHRRQFNHELGGDESVRGAKTIRVMFEEVGSPTVIQQPDGGGDVRSIGTVWSSPSPVASGASK